MYNSIVTPALWTAAVVESTPLVTEVTFTPDIEPLIISSPIFKNTVPLEGKLVEEARTTVVSAAVKAVLSVVDIPEVTPDIVTLLEV
jgi:hypothetical protein